MSLCCGRGNVAHKSAFVKSSALRWILGELRYSGSLPRRDYVHLLIEHFRESTSPWSMRRVVFSPDEILYEYISASCHLPGAYAEFFPCPHCTHTDEVVGGSFVEVFHFPNNHDPKVCITVTFTMPAFYDVLADLRVALHIHIDIIVEVLRFLPRSELETAQLASRRWSNVIGRVEGSLQQRRSIFVIIIKFFGESSGMLSVHFLRREPSARAVRSHLRNAFVDAMYPIFLDSAPPPGPPREVLVDIPLSRRVNWLMSLLHSMPRNSDIDWWSVQDVTIGFDSLLPLARCALKPHSKLGCVQKLELVLLDDDATWAQLARLLNQPSVRGFSEIIISTRVSLIDTSELRTMLSSRQLSKLYLITLSETEPQHDLLTLPAQLIRDYLALRDVSSFAAEFTMRLGVVLPEMPAVNAATYRRKRFRCHLQGVDTVVRVNVYANRVARGCLTVVTFRHFRRTVLFFNRNVSLTDLKLILRRTYDLF
ncbi:hypothetical protein AAVH_33486 [Aphelenchoides avenae]|nr:hypothetical protein AAVH_33486 [Aphelenchus avenae]